MQNLATAVEATEAAVQTSTPTPEQIAAALEYITKANAAASITTTPDVNAEPEVQIESADSLSQNENVEAGKIDHEKKQELEEKFQELINTPRYWENPNRIKRLEEALVLPVYDNRSKQQFYISAKNDLIAKENKASMAEQRIPREITETQIMALAEEKYLQKSQRDAAKKKSKNIEA
jgi:hypothetical protein